MEQASTRGTQKKKKGSENTMTNTKQEKELLNSFKNKYKIHYEELRKHDMGRDIIPLLESAYLYGIAQGAGIAIKRIKDMVQQ